MKKLILLSAALMSVAFIYGSIDFIKANQSGEFQKIYSKRTPAKKALTSEEKNFISIFIDITQLKVQPIVAYHSTKPVQSITVTPEEERPEISFDEFSRGEPEFEEVAIDSEIENQLSAENNTTDSLPVSVDTTATDNR